MQKFNLTIALISFLLLVYTIKVLGDVGEEVEVTSGAVTALSCAREAQKTGQLELLSTCPLDEAQSGFVIFDIAEKKIYQISGAKVYHFELARAFGGGSIDFSGKVKIEIDEITEVEVEDYSVNPKPKPGAFKGCL
jgi:hypothetical protein